MNISRPKSLPAQYKTYIAVAFWFGLCLFMFLKAFNILDSSNQQTVLKIGVQKNSLALLVDERDSYLRAQKDVAQMKSLSIQPENLFSKDITLVKEIETLERWGNQLDVTLGLSGVTGTINTVPKAKTLTEVFVLPYSISLGGPFSQVLGYIQVLENLGFITNVSNLSIGAGSGDNVTASLSASFYLKK